MDPSEEELDRFGEQLVDEIIQEGRAEHGDAAYDWEYIRLILECDLLVTDEARAQLRRAYPRSEVDG